MLLLLAMVCQCYPCCIPGAPCDVCSCQGETLPQACPDSRPPLHPQGKVAEAEPICQEALQLYRSLLGEHALVVLALDNLGALLLTQDKLQEAEVVYRQALAMQQRLSGRRSSEVAVALYNLARVLHKQVRGREGVGAAHYRHRNPRCGHTPLFLVTCVGHLRYQLVRLSL